jgi:hypothetical protein
MCVRKKLEAINIKTLKHFKINDIDRKKVNKYKKLTATSRGTNSVSLHFSNR